MVLTEASVKNCIKNPPMAQPAELYGILPVIREDKKSGPGTSAFIKSVVAKAAMKRLVVVLRRGFLNTTSMIIKLPTSDRIRSKIHVNDSRITSSTGLKGIWFVIPLKNCKRSKNNCREEILSSTTYSRSTSLKIVEGGLFR